jgi:hypothetical protein
MFERIKDDLFFTILTLVSCLIWGAILYYYFFPSFIIEINKIEWHFVLMLYFSLLLWSLYFWIVKYQIKFFKSKEGQESVRGFSVYFLVFFAWVFCFFFSGIIYYFVDDFEHGFEYSIVSFLISIPYVTFEIIKFYILDKNKKP